MPLILYTLTLYTSTVHDTYTYIVHVPGVTDEDLQVAVDLLHSQASLAVPGQDLLDHCLCSAGSTCMHW